MILKIMLFPDCVHLTFVTFSLSWGQSYKTFYGRNLTDFRIKLECLSLASLSSLVYCLWVSLGAYLRVDHLKGSSLGQASAFLPTNINQTKLERLGRDKRSSLLRKSTNYCRKKFYSTAPWGPMLQNFLPLKFTNDDNNLESSFLGSLSSLV